MQPNLTPCGKDFNRLPQTNIERNDALLDYERNQSELFDFAELALRHIHLLVLLRLKFCDVFLSVGV